MIKAALEYLISLGNVKIQKDGDRVYSTQPLHVIKKPTPASITVRSLTGLVDYIKSEFDEELETERQLMIHVESPTEVEVFTTLNRDCARDTLIQAKAMLPEFRFGSFHNTEEFIIKLQAGFVPNEDRSSILKVVGNVQEQDVKTTGDNGISQTVTAKSGIAQVEEVLVPNPVILKPFRTFVEVDQPDSEFIFRMQKGPTAALFEADGGAWKLSAMIGIKGFLEKALEDEIKASKIVIIA